jgi:hypothetical protein
MHRSHCRCAADREQAALLRPPARIKSFAGKPRSNGFACAAIPLLRGARRSPACRRWAAQRPQNPTTTVPSNTPRAPVYCRCAADREQAALLRPAARIKSFAGKPRSNGFACAAIPLLRGARRSPACRRWAAQRPQNPTTSVPSDKPRAPISLPLRGRSRASCAPTACGQNQKRLMVHSDSRAGSGQNQKFRGQASLQRICVRRDTASARSA